MCTGRVTKKVVKIRQVFIVIIIIIVEGGCCCVSIDWKRMINSVAGGTCDEFDYVCPDCIFDFRFQLCSSGPVTKMVVKYIDIVDGIIIGAVAVVSCEVIIISIVEGSRVWSGSSADADKFK